MKVYENDSEASGAHRELIGYIPTQDYSYVAINRSLRAFHGEHLSHIASELTTVGAFVDRDETTNILTVNREFTVALSIARCREIHEREYRWDIRLNTSLLADITVSARMAPGNTSILDYYLFPSIDVPSNRFRLSVDNALGLDVYRNAHSLLPLINLSRPTLLPGGSLYFNPQIVLIPIAEIRIVIPRSRNRITFRAITANIASIGLKKPITVHERALEDDGTRYDLVCGQGRLEAFRDLGDAMIHAIINDSPRTTTI